MQHVIGVYGVKSVDFNLLLSILVCRIKTILYYNVRFPEEFSSYIKCRVFCRNKMPSNAIFKDMEYVKQST